MKIVYTLVLALAMMLPIVAQSTTNPSETDVLETIFRYQLARCYRERSPQRYFLSYERHDPSDALMDRFKNDLSHIGRRSQRRGYKGARPGDYGILLAVAKIEWLNDHSVVVMGSCDADTLDGYSYTYRAMRKRRGWIVTRARLTGVADLRRPTNRWTGAAGARFAS
jgi:hypothetical protein